MPFLEKIVTRLQSFTSSNSEDSAISVESFFADEMIWLLQKSLLAGEYYDDTGDKIQQIGILLTSMELLSEDQENSRAWHSVNSNELKRNVLIVRDFYLQKTNDLFQNVDKGLRNFSQGVDAEIVDIKLFQHYALINDMAEVLALGSTKEGNIYNYTTFSIGLLLVYMDEYLECSQESVSILRNVKEFLNRLGTNIFSEEVVPLYIHKAEFLEYKIHHRNAHITSDGEGSHVGLVAMPSTNKYYPFYEKIIKHYTELKHESSSNIQRAVTEIWNGDQSNFKVGPLHHLNKYYSKLCDNKNFVYRKDKIDAALTELKKKESYFPTLSIYDQIAFNSAYKLLSNSSYHLRLKIEKSNHYPNIIPHFQKYLAGEASTPEPDVLNTYISTARNIADEKNFPDYYCYIILIKFLNSLLNYLTENPDSILPGEIKSEKIADIKLKIYRAKQYLERTYDQAIIDLKASLRKMITYEVKPIYLTKEECKIEHFWSNESEIGILFLDSAYILPNNFQKISKRVESWEAFVAPQMNIFLEAFEISISGKAVKSGISAFESKMKENEFKVVQIVALFVSIATFVLINVKIFDNKTGLESFAIIIGLAACFFLFNLFFYFVVLVQFQGVKKGMTLLAKISVALFLPALLAIGSFLILRNEKYTTNADIKSLKEKVRNDSLQIERIKQRVFP